MLDSTAAQSTSGLTQDSVNVRRAAVVALYQRVHDPQSYLSMLEERKSGGFSLERLGPNRRSVRINRPQDIIEDIDKFMTDPFINGRAERIEGVSGTVCFQEIEGQFFLESHFKNDLATLLFRHRVGVTNPQAA